MVKNSQVSTYNTAIPRKEYFEHNRTDFVFDRFENFLKDLLGIS